jgi:hypothetical protein
VTLVVIGVRLSPLFSASVLSILTFCLCFILSENLWTHDAAEFENRFWTLVAMSFSYTCVFVKDSPLRFDANRPGFAWLIVLSVTFAAHNYDRHVRRLILKRIPIATGQSSAASTNVVLENAVRKISDIQRLISIVDNTWFSSDLQGLILSPRVVFAERSIIRILSDATTSELNTIVCHVGLGHIFYKVKDHRISRQMNRTKLLNILAVERIGELSVASRAIVLDALQRMKLSAHNSSEIFAKAIILKTREDRLSELKSLMDSKGDSHSMHKLIYKDIRSQLVRTEILDHIQKQAKIQAARTIIGSKARRKRGFAWRKIVSDVDDTLLCSFGSFPAGLDKSFPKKTLYPGVLAFYRELDLGLGGGETWDDARIGNLVFLSARPHVYKDVSQRPTFDTFRWLQDARGLHTCPSLLSGNLDSGSRFFFRGSMQPLATDKYHNLKEYMTLYPEFKFVFVGDNGQGDVRALEMILENNSLASNIERVYIHKVQSISATFTKNLVFDLFSGGYFYFFDTYVDAACDAYMNGLIRCTSLQRIMVEAKRDFRIILQSEWNNVGDSNEESSTQKDVQQRKLNVSLDRGNGELAKSGLEFVKSVSFISVYDPGTLISTILGLGVINNFRKEDGIFTVRLFANIFLNGLYSAICYMPSHSLISIDSEKFGFKILDHNKADIQHITTSGQKRPTSSSRLYHASRNHDLNSENQHIVWTFYGRALFVSIRANDKIVELIGLDWPSRFFLPSARVTFIAK